MQKFNILIAHKDHSPYRAPPPGWTGAVGRPCLVCGYHTSPPMGAELATAHLPAQEGGQNEMWMSNCYQGTQKRLQRVFPLSLSSFFPLCACNQATAWFLPYGRDSRVKAASWPLLPWEGVQLLEDSWLSSCPRGKTAQNISRLCVLSPPDLPTPRRSWTGTKGGPRSLESTATQPGRALLFQA